MANSRQQDLETSVDVEIEIGCCTGETRGVIGSEFRGEIGGKIGGEIGCWWWREAESVNEQN